MGFRYLDSFNKLCATARKFGVKTGLEHMGHQMTEIGRLTDVGLDFMKIDVFFVKDVHKDSVNQNLLKTLATLAHSIGIDAIAEGVASEDELLMVDKLGLDGASGPIVTQQFDEKKA
jgi:EAL domain-containing protein (putative c-di-GMP-specific phosphodiesterase class I)